ncbi:MAG: S1 family peptidase [Chitinophagales bacterium]|jgi:hypothetical protein|nr:S1 family peptidase [Chitinophagales bacterium]
MNRISISLLLCLWFQVVFGQFTSAIENPSIPITFTAQCDKLLLAEALMKNEKGLSISAVFMPFSLSLRDAQIVKINPDNSQIVQFKIYSPEAKGLSLKMNKKNIDWAKIRILDKDYTQIIALGNEFNSQDEMVSSIIDQDQIILEAIIPANSQSVEINITGAYHFFKSSQAGFNDSDNCIINANCNDADTYRDYMNSTVRILVTGTNFAGWCTGTLINNTAKDLKPYILTANHCSEKSTLNDLKNWKFYFFYQQPGCLRTSVEPSSIVFNGCNAKAYPDNDVGDNSSDYLLLELFNPIPASYNISFLGWNATLSNFTNTAVFHHPNGDVKKFSRVANTTQLNAYANSSVSRHHTVRYATTSLGYVSSTQVGSSGSALLTTDGKIIGTLSGGNASCGLTNGIDMYGALYFGWDKYSTNPSKWLKTYLDPINSGATVFDKISNSPTVSIQDYQAENPPFSYKLNQGHMYLKSIAQPLVVKHFSLLGQLINSMTIAPYDEIEMPIKSKGVSIIEISTDNQRKIIKVQQ